MNNNQITEYLIDCIGLDEDEIKEIKQDYNNNLIKYLTNEQIIDCKEFNNIN